MRTWKPIKIEYKKLIFLIFQVSQLPGMKWSMSAVQSRILTSPSR